MVLFTLNYHYLRGFPSQICAFWGKLSLLILWSNVVGCTFLSIVGEFFKLQKSGKHYCKGDEKLYLGLLKCFSNIIFSRYNCLCTCIKLLYSIGKELKIKEL